MYSYDKPVAWYFTSNGVIKSKNKSNLNVKNIREVFLKNCPNCEIVATFAKKIHKGNDESYIFEYFDRDDFEKFLMSKDSRPNGILQSFIQPKGENNCTFAFFTKN